MRVAVAVSGGADSVALLRALAEEAREIGLVLMTAHVHHGIRGTEADQDERFVAELANRLGLEAWSHRVETPAVAREKKQTLEETARELRYEWFRELLTQGRVDAVATAHTLDDQAETVVHRLLRGTWTEGLGGIHPIVRCRRGIIVRPFLETRRLEIRVWLRETGQEWREDATNEDRAHTRNRIRGELMPHLAEYNPQITEQLAHLATIARDEEAWWAAELAKLLPALLLPGKPVRGGGRAVPTHPLEGEAGMELERLRALAPAVRRRVLRAAAKEVGCALNFEQTERLMAMCEPTGARKQELAVRLWAEKSARELRLVRGSRIADKAESPTSVTIPGEGTGFGVKLRIRLPSGVSTDSVAFAILRTPKAGDRVKIRHSRAAKPLKEIFERMRVANEERRTWPVLEWQGRIVWMKGVEVEPEVEVPFAVEAVDGQKDI